MNILYEKLFADFLVKANVERDANQIIYALKKVYPNCSLPIAKTIKRFLNGETTNLRDTSLGFFAAYILDITEPEVIDAYCKNTLGNYYKIFLEKKEPASSLHTPSPVPSRVSAATTTFVNLKKDRNKTIAIWTLCIALPLLVGFIGFIKIMPVSQKAHVQFPTMIPLKGGSFTMGDTFKDSKQEGDELPCHKVNVDSFEMSQTEITFELFDAYCLAKNIPLKEDLGWGRGHHPAIMMDWFEAIDFCNWLSDLKGLQPVYSVEKNSKCILRKVNHNFKNNGYRLPTEAEWEYAASVNLKTNIKYRFGNHKNVIDDALNFNFNENTEKASLETFNSKIYYKKTVSVMESGMNQNGLYGMVGNVSEWCHDYYHPHFYQDNVNNNNPIAENVVVDTSCAHILRGGAWSDSHIQVRATSRKSSPANCRSEQFGFRVVRSIQKKSWYL